MTLQLEVGKYYRTSDGRVFGPLYPHIHPDYPFGIENGTKTWTKTGLICRAVCHRDDLVAEVDAPPVATTPTDEGRKDDSDKLPLELIPTDVIEAIAEILQFGANKYAPRNWEKGMAWSRPYSACLRHLFAWFRGEAADPETGKSHLAHACCCLFFMLAYELRGVGTDDRPKKDA